METRGAAGRGSRFSKDSRTPRTNIVAPNLDKDRATVSLGSPRPPVTAANLHPRIILKNFNILLKWILMLTYLTIRMKVMMK